MVHLKHHTIKSNGWLLTGLVAFTAVALFPYGWLADNWRAFDLLTGFLFRSEMAHIVGHIGLFVLLGTAVLIILPRLRQQPVLYFGLMAALGSVQEFLQLTTFKNRQVGASDLFDLAVDLLAAGIVFVIARNRVSQRNPVSN